ncbi:GNAT family N-acetyltransferase [Curtobacterium sp. RRHDQ10]|uniref:GNAT family N-acetyltransferase n=1 Tax=Curtobacterium phyllosphaerae TaxID=3413379 RepID=UPI003BF245FC
MGDPRSLTSRARDVVGRITAGARPVVAGMPRTAARTLARAARGSTARRILNEELLNEGPSGPADILGNYLRGYVPLGDSDQGDAIAWTLVQPRSVIDAGSVHIPDRVRRYSRNTDLTIDLRAPLDDILAASADRGWTWITPTVADAWKGLDRAGAVRSCGAYHDGELVAGLWGLELGSTFAIMSIFHHENRAGTVLLARVMGELGAGVEMIDCGFVTEHMPRFGAYEIPLDEFKRRCVAGLHPAVADAEPDAAAGGGTGEPVADASSAAG